METGTRRAIVLKTRPDGAPRRTDFELIEEAIPHPGAGEVLTRTLFLSIDPYMRGRLSARKSYARGIEPGDLMTGETVGVVLASKHPDFHPGQMVCGARGWASHLVSNGRALAALPAEAASLSAYLGVLGMPGCTAYSGLKDIGRPQAGETVVVSAASGAVGSVVGQLAKLAGARVVGIAGGMEKCLYVQAQLGFDACIDHRANNLGPELDLACPEGIDVYFENVGGRAQAEAFKRMRDFGRIVMCGMVSQYNENEPAPGPNLMSVIAKRLHIQGLIVSDKPERFAEWRAYATPLVREGKLRYREHVVDGLENAPDLLAGVLEGRNFGKAVIRVAAA